MGEITNAGKEYAADLRYFSWSSFSRYSISVISCIAIAASSLFYTPARQNVTTLELLISKPFICGDEQRHDMREKTGGVRDNEKYQGSKD